MKASWQLEVEESIYFGKWDWRILRESRAPNGSWHKRWWRGKGCASEKAALREGELIMAALKTILKG